MSENELDKNGAIIVLNIYNRCKPDTTLIVFFEKTKQKTIIFRNDSHPLIFTFSGKVEYFLKYKDIVKMVREAAKCRQFLVIFSRICIIFMSNIAY